MSIMSDAIARSRSETARVMGDAWQVLPRSKKPDARAEPATDRAPFLVTARLFAPDAKAAKSSVNEAFETGRFPGMVADAPMLTVLANPTGGVIRQHDVVMEMATGKKWNVSSPPGGDATGHVRLDLDVLS